MRFIISEQEDKISNKRKIIIYDGDCLFCNGAASFLHRRLNSDTYDFIASQSNIGKELLNNYNLHSTVNETIVVIIDNKIFTKSDAIIEIINDMPIIWKPFKIIKLIPKNFRNWIYSVISKNRHHLIK